MRSLYKISCWLISILEQVSSSRWTVLLVDSFPLMKTSFTSNNMFLKVETKVEIFQPENQIPKEILG